jgi:hypothetical protein
MPAMNTGHRGRASPLPVAATIAVAGLVVGVAAPHCDRLRRRAATGEAQSSLRALATLQTARHDLEHRYVASPAELGFSPAAGDPYVYFFADPSACAGAPDAPPPPDPGLCVRTVSAGPSPDPGTRPVVVPVFSAGPDGRYLVSATANLDDDAVLDAWSIASYPRRGGAISGPETCAAGDTPAGEPCHDLVDLQR